MENFTLTLQSHRGDDAKILLSSLYFQFSDCESFQEVVSLSRFLAPCAFDLSQALEKHRTAPLSVDVDIIAHHIWEVSTLGLSKVLQNVSLAVIPITLQSNVVPRNFSAVSTFQPLTSFAVVGVVTSLNPSFQPNGGFNCPTYDASISNSDVLSHLLSEGNKSDRLIIVPLALAQKCAQREGLIIYSSPAFLAPKRENELGSIVVNFSNDGPNYLSTKLYLNNSAQSILLSCDWFAVW